MNKLFGIGCCCALMTFFYCAVPGTVRSAQTTCARSKIVVVAGKSTELEGVCTAVQNGLVILRSLGLDYSESLVITLLKTMPSTAHEGVLGQYDRRSNEIRLLDYESAVAASRRLPPAFGIPMSPALWHGYVVHELAHAVAHQKFAAGVPICTASEYIASVAQIASLQSPEREDIFRNYPELSGFDTPGEITLGYYLLDPNRFSVNAYLHFSKPENGPVYISRLMREGLPDD